MLISAKADKAIRDREVTGSLSARLDLRRLAKGLVCPKAMGVRVMVWCPWAVDGPSLIVHLIPSVFCLDVDVFLALVDEQSHRRQGVCQRASTYGGWPRVGVPKGDGVRKGDGVVPMGS